MTLFKNKSVCVGMVGGLEMYGFKEIFTPLSNFETITISCYEKQNWR